MSRTKSYWPLIRLLAARSNATSCSKSACNILASIETCPSAAIAVFPVQLTCLRPFRPTTNAWPLGVRTLSTTQQPGSSAGSQKAERKPKSLVVEDEQFSAITDQIPQRPMGVVEGTSYTLVILAALGVAIAVLYVAVNELLLQPKEYTCFNLALDKLREDPRVTVRLGTPISGYGQESRNRAARQRVPHRIYKDENDVEHVQVQFQAKGPSAVATVVADMYQDSNKQWQYRYLFLDISHPRPQRLYIVDPSYAEPSY